MIYDAYTLSILLPGKGERLTQTCCFGFCQGSPLWCGGQRATRLPLVHLVVPLATSNSFAPLADDDDRPASSRRTASALEPSATLEESRVTWAEVMSMLSAKLLSILFQIRLAWMLALRMDGHLLTTMPRPHLETHLRIPAIDNSGTDLKLASRTCSS